MPHPTDGSDSGLPLNKENILRTHLIAFATAALLPCGLAAQEWNLMTFWQGQPWQGGTLRLTEYAPGKHRVRVVIPQKDMCLDRDLEATVHRSGGELFIELQQLYRDCPAARYVVKEDGTGGRREVRQPDGSWARPDAFDRILTRK